MLVGLVVALWVVAPKPGSRDTRQRPRGCIAAALLGLDARCTFFIGPVLKVERLYARGATGAEP